MLAVPARNFSAAIISLILRCGNRNGKNLKRYVSLAKNATTIAPGPTCVPMVLPMEVTGSVSNFPSQISRLAAIYSRSASSLLPE